MKTLLSIIVPVYNAEKWLRKCVESLLNQDLPSENYEIILVDDGSKDGSPQICDDYAATHPGLVRVVHQPNAGVSIARNHGIDVAKGEYLSFVDADDFVDRKFASTLIKEAHRTGSDIISCGFYENTDGGCNSVMQIISSTNNEQIIIEMFKGIVFGAMWNKIYKRDFVISGDIKVIGHLCEDLHFNVQCLLNGAKIAGVDECLYYYNRNNGSCRRPMNQKMGDYAVEISRHFCEMLKNHKSMFSAFVKHEMPWMAYLALYYNSCSSRQYKQEFVFLLNESVFKNERIIKLALKQYSIACIIMELRKMISKIINR